MGRWFTVVRPVKPPVFAIELFSVAIFGQLAGLLWVIDPCGVFSIY